MVLLSNGLFFFVFFYFVMYNVTQYRLKVCREKVRQEVEPREEGGRGAALREWEKLGYSCYLYEPGVKLQL